MMMRALVLTLLFSAGCGGFWGNGRGSREPLKPSEGVKGGDLVFLRTGDRAFYYVVDKRRRICFFHATMYGKTHLETIDCAKLPEAKGILGPAPVADGGREEVTARQTSPARRAPRVVEPPPVRRVTPRRRLPRLGPEETPLPAPPVAEAGLTEGERSAFRRAYVQRFCSRREGREEALEVILRRHGLDQERWDLAIQEFSSDRELWSALTNEALDACP